jgi:hypothetical protein
LCCFSEHWPQDDAIAEITGLTIGQVRYRIMKAESIGRRKGQPTQRTLYRRGESPAVQAVIKPSRQEQRG